MKNPFFISLFSVLIVGSADFAAASASTSASATATRAASAAEQLAQASRLWREMENTPAPRKLELFAEVWSNLTLVRRAWPDDKVSTVRSAIMQADLAGELGILPNAVTPLLEVLPTASHTGFESQVERRLGQAYEQMGNAQESEEHFLAAERAIHSSHAGRVEAEETLSNVAMFYSRHNNPRAAMQRFREAANLPGQDVVNQMHFQLAIAEQAARLGKDSAAPEFARFDDFVSAAHHTTLSAADANAVNNMMKHAQRIRDKEHE